MRYCSFAPVFRFGIRGLLLLLLFLSAGGASAQEDLRVLNTWRRHRRGRKMRSIPKSPSGAYRALDSRDRAIEGIKTRGQWEARIADTRKRLRAAFGPFPERTPLNARVTRSFEENGIAVELVTFESRPGFTVTGAFFKPAGSAGKLPAILYLCGHSETGFRYESYQRVIQNLARKGFAVFTIDPVGQGERLQYFDPAQGKSRIGGPTAEHSYPGMQYLLLGRTLAMVRVWDAMRALDYLAERPDVDMTRIGAHGRSGGGTLSAYIGAMDERITAVAPENYLTNFRRLFQSAGPQDAEQNLLSQISSGLDLGDFIIARAPKPTLVVTTTRDMFSIQGAREMVASTLPAFAALGKNDLLRMIEDDAPHQSTRINRERVYSFFMEYLGVKGSPADEDIPAIDPAKLRVTTNGQTVLSGSKTVYDFIKEDSRAIFESLEQSRTSIITHREKVKKAVDALSGLSPDTVPFETVSSGRFQRQGYTVEKVIIGADRTIPIPALLFIPDSTDNRADKRTPLLFLNGIGKIADAAPGGRIEALVHEGYPVLAPDLPGCGELGGDSDGDSVIGGVNYNLVFGAQLIGGSVTGIQAEAILRCLRWLEARNKADSAGFTAIAVGTAGPPLLHAASLEPRLRATAFLNAPLSWEFLLEHRYYSLSLGMTVVPSALTRYDLPDLLGLTDSRRTLALDPVGGDGEPASAELREKTTRTVNQLRKETGGEFIIAVSNDAGTQEKMLMDWVKGGGK